MSDMPTAAMDMTDARLYLMMSLLAASMVVFMSPAAVEMLKLHLTRLLGVRLKIIPDTPAFQVQIQLLRRAHLLVRVPQFLSQLLALSQEDVVRVFTRRGRLAVTRRHVVMILFQIRTGREDVFVEVRASREGFGGGTYRGEDHAGDGLGLCLVEPRAPELARSRACPGTPPRGMAKGTTARGGKGRRVGRGRLGRGGGGARCGRGVRAREVFGGEGSARERRSLLHSALDVVGELLGLLRRVGGLEARGGRRGREGGPARDGGGSETRVA